MQDSTNPVELPLESFAQIAIVVIFPGTVFESFVTVIVVGRVVLGVIGQSQVFIDFGYPGGVWAVFVVMVVGHIIVPCWRLRRFDLWLPVRLSQFYY
jgi:hypothetical protein